MEKDLTKVQNFKYDEEKDEYIYECDRRLVFKFEQNCRSDNGYVSAIRMYECLDCSRCSHREICVKSENPQTNRRLNINRKLNVFKEKAKQNLCSKIGLEMRSLRTAEVESVFVDIKGNFGMRRFLLKGLDKVSIEWGIHSIVHNMRKMAALMG